MARVQVILMTSLMVFVCFHTSSGRPRCKIRCGVINTGASFASWPEIINAAWADLSHKERLKSVEFQFVPITKRTRLSMDDLIGVYMEIGTTNVTAMMGPFVAAIATASEKFKIPYFVTAPPSDIYQRSYNIISVVPNVAEVTKVLVALVKAYGWKSIGVVYEDMFGVKVVEEMTSLPSIRTRSWKCAAKAALRDIRKALLTARQHGVRHFILAVPSRHVGKILSQALRLSMLTNRYSWIVALLTQEAIDLDPFAYTQVNLTTMRLVRGDFQSLHQVSLGSSMFEYATVWDSLLTLYHAVKDHHIHTGDCHWTGRSISSILRKLRIHKRGATGDLTFYSSGLRKSYSMDILSLGDFGLYKIGYWNSSLPRRHNRLKINGMKNTTKGNVQYLAKKTIRVVTLLEQPFVQMSPSPYPRSTSKYEGFGIDLLEAIASMLKFKYEIYVVPDGKYGSQLPDGSWNGLVGELIVGNASLAVAPLTIDYQRESVIDFSKPFMTFGISMLMQEPPEDSNIFYFLHPLSQIIWYLFLGCLVMLTITLYVLDRIVKNGNDAVRFNAGESLWFVFASLVQANTEVIPRTLSSRILASSIWFFALIVISSYTANLAAFFTITNITPSILSVNDLPSQSRVRYGTVMDSHVSKFFENNKLENFNKMWTSMSSLYGGTMVKRKEDGVRKVKNSQGKYVFLWDSPAIRYELTQHCTLREVGQPFYSFGYGIGLPLGAPYKEDITMAILKLRDNGKLHKMEEKWWRNTKCSGNSGHLVRHEKQPLSIDRLAGVFMVLVGGIVLSLIVGVLEYYFYTCKERRMERKKRRECKANVKASAAEKATLESNMIFEPSEADHLTITNSGGSKHTNIF